MLNNAKSAVFFSIAMLTKKWLASKYFKSRFSNLLNLSFTRLWLFQKLLMFITDVGNVMTLEVLRIPCLCLSQVGTRIFKVIFHDLYMCWDEKCVILHGQYICLFTITIQTSKKVLFETLVHNELFSCKCVYELFSMVG